MDKLKGRVVAVDAIDEAERREMYALFELYYEEISYQRFCRDLSDKSAVILLRDRAGAIQGFSTVKTVQVRHQGKTHRAIFSGDTVIARRYWGQKVLGKVFLRHLFLEMARRPTQPLWWFLITKGYKTYLLMANNFAVHYPRFEAETPAPIKELRDAFGDACFPSHYDARTGLIQFDSSHGQLKGNVAPITDELRGNPRIAFFERENPGWEAGSELACIARMTWTMPLYYSLKAIAKTARLPGRRRPVRALPAR